jgi:hypothetical protein
MQQHSDYGKFATLYENKVVVTYEPLDGKRKNFNASDYHRNPTNARYTGAISKNAQKTISKRLHGWVYSMLTAKSNNHKRKRSKRYKPIFVTLTLPAKQQHTDKEIKSKVLELFIKRLQYHFKVKHYFWRAEVQKNGNLHFHLIFDRYLKKDSISYHWNECLENLGYVTAFEKKHGHRNPPATNVRQLYSNSANIWYLIKYVGKAHKGRKIEGALFRFSQSLRDIKPLKIWLDRTDGLKLRQFVKDKVSRVFSDDWFSVVYLNRSYSLLPFLRGLGASFDEVANHCFNLLYPAEPPPQPEPILLATKSAQVIQKQLFTNYGM